MTATVTARGPLKGRRCHRPPADVPLPDGKPVLTIRLPQGTIAAVREHGAEAVAAIVQGRVRLLKPACRCSRRGRSRRRLGRRPDQTPTALAGPYSAWSGSTPSCRPRSPVQPCSPS